MFEKFVRKRQNERVSTLLWAKGLRWLRWLEEPCFENYVEMVAGLPINEQNNDQELFRLVNRVF